VTPVNEDARPATGPTADPASSEVNEEQPNVARVYDYLLGGSHNFAADRAMAEQVLAVVPNTRRIAQANRAFLRRAVAFLATNGVTQFLDLGSGIPTVGNVHEIAQDAHPGARVLYVDIEPVAVTHSATMLADNPDADVIRADLRDPDTVLDAVRRGGLLDLSAPIALLAVSVLHFVPDADLPQRLLARYRDALAPGSYLTLSHLTPVGLSADEASEGTAIYERSSSALTLRPVEEIAAMFDGYTLVEPGLAPVEHWRPDEPVSGPSLPVYAGVGLLR
jgi:hypothetical protein